MKRKINLFFIILVMMQLSSCITMFKISDVNKSKAKGVTQIVSSSLKNAVHFTKAILLEHDIKYLQYDEVNKFYRGKIGYTYVGVWFDQYSESQTKVTILCLNDMSSYMSKSFSEKQFFGILNSN